MWCMLWALIRAGNSLHIDQPHTFNKRGCHISNLQSINYSGCLASNYSTQSLLAVPSLHHFHSSTLCDLITHFKLNWNGGKPFDQTGSWVWQNYCFSTRVKCRAAIPQSHGTAETNQPWVPVLSLERCNFPAVSAHPWGHGRGMGGPVSIANCHPWCWEQLGSGRMEPHRISGPATGKWIRLLEVLHVCG